jgi:hypothetical protein
VAPSPDNQELGIARRLEELGYSVPFEELALDFDAWLLLGCTHRRVENIICSTPEVFVHLVDGRARQRQADDPGLGESLEERHHPRMHDMEGRSSDASLCERPKKRLMSTRGSVYSDDDLSHHG